MRWEVTRHFTFFLLLSAVLGGLMRTPRVALGATPYITRSDVAQETTAAQAAGNVLFVDQDAAGPSHDGSTWCTALFEISDALEHATSGTEIRVANGAYYPDPTDWADPREATFLLTSGVTVIGGFAGCGAMEPDLRDTTKFETILSGVRNSEEAQNSEQGAGQNSGEIGHQGAVGSDRNCYHVVTAGGTASNTRLEGVTITGGQADADVFPHDHGGGILNISGHLEVVDCTLTGNFATLGGAMHNRNGAIPLIINTVFINNEAEVFGGAILNHGSSPVIRDSSFVENRARVGGAIGGLVNSHPEAYGCLFERNEANKDGGAVLIWGGSSIFEDCEFIANQAAYYGGAMSFQNDADPQLLRCTLRDNVSGEGAGAIDFGESLGVISACVFENNQTQKHGGALSIHGGGGPVVEISRFLGNQALGSRGLGGAIYNDRSRLTLVSSEFSGNYARADGGAINASRGSTIAATNCTFSQNQAGQGGGGIFSRSDSSQLTSCILWANREDGDGVAKAQIDADENALSISYSCIEALPPSLHRFGNIAENPLFVDSRGEDNVPGTTDDNHLLLCESPCINSGDPDFDSDSAPPVDSAGQPRVRGCRIDMGAYESKRALDRGDFNGDQAWNLRDVAVFQTCFGTLGVAINADPCLCVFDSDESGRVDLVDFADLYELLEGS